MKLYVCWGTFPVPWPRRGRSWRPSGHPCKIAHDALKDAGYSPEVVKSYGLAPLPDVTSGRKEVKRLTGESLVPVLVLDGGEVIKDSKNIVAEGREYLQVSGCVDAKLRMSCGFGPPTGIRLTQSAGRLTHARGANFGP